MCDKLNSMIIVAIHPPNARKVAGKECHAELHCREKEEQKHEDEVPEPVLPKRVTKVEGSG
jgi:hypothetical protein